MKILYIGDIMGRPGRELIQKLLPEIRKEHSVDLVIAQAENMSHGKGTKPQHIREMQQSGVDFFTGGNHTATHPSIIPLLEDANEPVIRPANYPAGTKGRGYKFISTTSGDVLVISLLGQIVGKDADVPVDNPLFVVDEILEKTKGQPKVATIVNFHGDFSSEKVVIGHYLDGRVTAVIGDHWHVPTADARVLPKGTAHITDVGMVGSLNSSLGIKLDVIFQRWRGEAMSKNELEDDGASQFCSVLIGVDTQAGLAKNIQQLKHYIN